VILDEPWEVRTVGFGLELISVDLDIVGDDRDQGLALLNLGRVIVAAAEEGQDCELEDIRDKDKMNTLELAWWALVAAREGHPDVGVRGSAAELLRILEEVGGISFGGEDSDLE
jgi:hypothetical protein